MSAEPMCFEDRLAFATEALRLRFIERDRFLSDSDVLDIADDWTTSDRSWLHEDDIDFDDPRIDDSDYRALLHALDAVFDRVVEEGMS